MRDFDYSRTMENYLDDWNRRLQSLYCRDDFVDNLARLDRAGEDNQYFVKRDLEEKCAMRGLDADALIVDRSLLMKIPTRDEVLDEILELFHENYMRCYTTDDFMTRIVRRLAPEFREDPVRVAILKKFILGMGFRWRDGKKIQKTFRTGSILQWALDRFTYEEVMAYETLSEEEKLELIVSKLDDSIFSDEHLNIELNEIERFRLIVNRLTKWNRSREITTDAVAAKKNLVIDASLMEDFPLKDKTVEVLRAFCEENRLPFEDKTSNISKLLVIKEALDNGMFDAGCSDVFLTSVFPLLEGDFKDFLRSTYYKKEDGSYQEFAKLYKTDLRDARKKKRADWELLLLCDDFAKGNFRTNGGKTRILLYYFAMMFGMTVRCGDSNAYDPETDLEKNLFEDYYSDNVLRYLQDEYVNPKTVTKYESEPAGDGINYKNYTEIIYLYYIYHRELTLDPGESIDRAETLILECGKEAAKRGTSALPSLESAESEERFTEYFRETHFQRFINLEEDSLLEYLLEHYQIFSDRGGGMSKAMISSEEETAYDTLEFIIDVLNDTYDSSIRTSQLLKDEFGEWDQKEAQLEIQESSNVLFRWELPKKLHEKYSGDETFLRIVDNLDRRLSNPIKNISAEEKRISRGTFLSMCLSDFISQFSEKIDSFPKLYRNFVDEVNERLLAARFQLFKGTNLMDLYILFSLYFYVVKNGKEIPEGE